MIGMVLLFLGASLPDGAQEAYQTAVVLIAAALIVQMVIWMRRHGRTLKRDLETSLSGAAQQFAMVGRVHARAIGRGAGG